LTVTNHPSKIRNKTCFTTAH